MRILRLYIIAALLVGASSTAEAQRVRTAKQAKRETKALTAASFKVKRPNVASALKAATHNKPLRVVARAKGLAYSKAMKNTIEIIYQPFVSKPGHLMLRVGQRSYDMLLSGPNPVSFGSSVRSSPDVAYGFVYKSSSKQIAELQRRFNDLSATSEFYVKGVGKNKFNCASFITSTLSKYAPELKIDFSTRAIKAASKILLSGNYSSVSLYGPKAEVKPNNADFTFDKLQ